MKKRVNYFPVRFPAEVLKEAQDLLASRMTEEEAKSLTYMPLRVRLSEADWDYDTYEQFAARYRRNPRRATFYAFFVNSLKHSLHVSMDNADTDVTVEAPDLQTIESVFDVFERNMESSKIEAPPVPKPVIFIGHGKSKQWVDLKMHLQDQHGYQIEAYETGARAGHTIRDILEDMAAKSSFALLVLTAEDEQSDKSMRARQNVVHETGLFQGKLGFNRAIVLLEDGAEEFSNLAGIQQLRFSNGNIREAFGDVLAVLKREFG